MLITPDSFLVPWKVGADLVLTEVGVRQEEAINGERVMEKCARKKGDENVNIDKRDETVLTKKQMTVSLENGSADESWY